MHADLENRDTIIAISSLRRSHKIILSMLQSTCFNGEQDLAFPIYK